MFIEGTMNFTLPTITNDTTSTVSTNVYDAGAAVKLFEGSTGARCKGKVKVKSDDTTTFKVDILGADNAALTSNPLVIASTGTVSTKDDGTAIGNGGSGTVCNFELALHGQAVAKRYYGAMLTLGGTNPDNAASQPCQVVLDVNTNLSGNRP